MPLWLPDYHVPPCEESFEYDPDWGGPAPVLWLHAGHGSNKGDTTAFGLSPYRNNGTWSGSTTGRSVVTERGRAWSLDPANSDYVSLARANGSSHTVNFTGDFSIGLWAYTEATSSDRNLFRNEDNTTTKWMGIGVMGDNTVTVDMDDGSTKVSFDSTGTVPDSAWFHLLLTRQTGVGYKLYLNGVQDATTGGNNGDVDGGFTLYFGRGMTSSIGALCDKDWWGKLREAATWTHCLTPQQIWNLYTSTLDGSPGCMARPIGRRVFKATAVTPTATVAGRLPQRRVEPYEAEFEYDPDWGGPAPVLWLHAGHGSNKGDTTAFGLSPYRNNGTWSGSTTGRSIVTERGRAWSTNGTDDEAAGQAASSSEFAVALWVNFDDVTWEGYVAWDTNGTHNYGDHYITIKTEVSGNLHAYIRAGSDAQLNLETTGLGTGQWYFVVAQSSAAQSELWVDGALADTGASRSPSMTHWFLGSSNDTNYGPMKVRALALFDRALTPGELHRLYTSSLDGSPGIMAKPIGRRVFAVGGAEGNEQTASLSVVSAGVAQPSVTATYESALSASVAAVVASVEQPSVTALSGTELTASLSTVVASVAQPAVTGQHAIELSAGTAVVVASVAQPEVTGQYASEISAGTVVVAAGVVQPEVTATYESQLSAGLSVVVASVEQPSTTATHQAHFTAGTAVVVASVQQPAVTAAATNHHTASLATVVASVAQPSVTATYESVLSAGVAVVTAAVAQPEVTSTWVLQASAGTAAVVTTVAQPEVTATYGVVYSASLAVVAASVAQPAVTATHESHWSAGVSPVEPGVDLLEVACSWALAATASLETVVASVAIPTVSASTAAAEGTWEPAASGRTWSPGGRNRIWTPATGRRTWKP